MKWIDVDDQLPNGENHVLVSVYNKHHKTYYVTMAKYVYPRTISGEFAHEDYDEKFLDYDKENDSYWLPSDWYDTYEHEECFVRFSSSDMVLAWIPLPEPYKFED